MYIESECGYLYDDDEPTLRQVRQPWLDSVVVAARAQAQRDADEILQTCPVSQCARVLGELDSGLREPPYFSFPVHLETGRLGGYARWTDENGATRTVDILPVDSMDVDVAAQRLLVRLLGILRVNQWHEAREFERSLVPCEVAPAERTGLLSRIWAWVSA